MNHDGSLRAALALALCCASLFMTTLDNTILNVAIPSIQVEFAAATSRLQWAVSGYALARAGLLFWCGSLSDRVGRRRCFRWGVAVFTLGSIGCGLAPTIDALLAFRVGQAVGGALMIPASLALISSIYPDPERRAMAIGVWTATTGLSMAAGPVVGGLLVETVGWRSVFWVNVPVGVLALAGSRILRESRAARPRAFDLPGQLLIATALGTLTYALIEGPAGAWRSPLVPLLLAGSVLLWVVFALVERRVPEPLLDLGYLRRPAFSASLAIAVVAFVALGGFLFYNTIYLQTVRGYSPLQAGLLTFPTTVSALFVAPLAGRITGRHGPALPAAAGMVGIAAAMLLLCLSVSPTTPAGLLLAAFLVLGVGIALVNPPINHCAISSLPPDRAGVASAAIGTARLTGTTLGVALLGSIVFTTATSVGTGARGTGALRGLSGSAFTSGLRHGYAFTAVLAVLACGLAVWAYARAGPPGG